VDSVQGVRIVARRPPASSTVSNRYAAYCPRRLLEQVLSCRRSRSWTLRALATAGSCSTSPATSHPKPLVLRTLDLLARYKLNVFHIHLTDDEGWRVENLDPPELTAVGARRGHPPDSDRHLQPRSDRGPQSTGPG